MSSQRRTGPRRRLPGQRGGQKEIAIIGRSPHQGAGSIQNWRLKPEALLQGQGETGGIALLFPGPACPERFQPDWKILCDPPRRFSLCLGEHFHLREHPGECRLFQVRLIMLEGRPTETLENSPPTARRRAFRLRAISY
jgi:hypothetical protein